MRNEFKIFFFQGKRNTWLLGDTGYLQRPYLMTPILNKAKGFPEYRYSRRHATARNCDPRIVEKLFVSRGRLEFEIIDITVDLNVLRAFKNDIRQQDFNTR